MINYTLTSKSKYWPARIKKINHLILKIIKFKKDLKFEKNIDYSCSFIFVDDKKMKDINKKFRKINKPTDVLTFVSDIKIQNNKHKRLCDIFFSAETIMMDAKKCKINFYDHLTHLVIHSFLHINGFVHNKFQDFLKMKDVEIKILKNLEIDNPYL